MNRQVYRIHNYADFLRWISQPTGRSGSLNGPGLTKVEIQMDLMFIHPKRWARLNDRAYRNTEEEKRRLNAHMEKFLEPSELIRNKEMIRNMLRVVKFKIPNKAVEARRVIGYKQFLANILIIIDEAYGQTLDDC